LREGIRRALADRLLETGDIEALATFLGVSERTARRWVKEGPPASWSEERLTRFAERLYATSRERETRPLEVQTELERRRQAPVYSEKARRAAARQLGRALGELEGRRPCEKGNWSPRVELAQRFGVRSRRLGRWIESGLVPSEFMPAVMGWAHEEAERALRRMAERGHVEALIDEARSPGQAHQLRGRSGKRAPRVPDLKSGEHVVDNDNESGYAWRLRAETWSTFERIAHWRDWALSRRRPARDLAGPARFWSVMAMCTIYAPKGRSITGGRTASGVSIKRYEGMIRQFERGPDRQRGRDLHLNVSVSSGRRPRGGLAYAVRLFVHAITAEHCEFDQVYVHYILVRNWRQRTAAQKSARYHTWKAKMEQETARIERARKAKRRRQRAASRTQSSRASSRRTPKSPK